MNELSPPEATADRALQRSKIVMVGPQHPGNIGAAARAMKVMGLTNLVLVAPERHPGSEARARASGAEDVLDAAHVCTTLEEAVSDCVLAIATSARQRRTRWPLTDVRQAAQRAVATSAQGPVALVFGRERAGLYNTELDICQLHMQIPANPDYSSLNLAAAVQVAAYEMRMASGQPDQLPISERQPVSVQDMEGLYRHWHDVLVASGFLNPSEPGILMRRLRRLFNRAAPDRVETNILRGALRALDPRALPNRKPKE